MMKILFSYVLYFLILCFDDMYYITEPLTSHVVIFLQVEKWAVLGVDRRLLRQGVCFHLNPALPWPRVSIGGGTKILHNHYKSITEKFSVFFFFQVENWGFVCNRSDVHFFW